MSSGLVKTGKDLIRRADGSSENFSPVLESTD